MRVHLHPYSFYETRSGAGTPVVLIHGLGGSSDWWRHNVAELAGEHLVSAVNLIGFGRNRFFLRRSSLPLTFPEIAALLARWIESSFP
jgi:pimeloyl-ACP methyl ester carboxylesterase